MEFKSIFNKVNFAERYRVLCDTYQDFDNRLRGTHNSIYKSVLGKLTQQNKYYSNGNFYQIISTIDRYEFRLNLVLKDGFVEALLYILIDNNPIIPQGRFDFLSEDLNIPFERKRFNLPIYGTEKELENILKEILLIQEDLKREILRNKKTT